MAVTVANDPLGVSPIGTVLSFVEICVQGSPFWEKGVGDVDAQRIPLGWADLQNWDARG